MPSNIKTFAIYAAERALKTFAQAALALIIAGHGLMSVSWGHVLDVAGLAMLVSIMTSLVAATGGTAPAGPESVVSPDADTDLSADPVTTAVNPANVVDPYATQQIPAVRG
jgi:hypothetical protein